MIGLLGANPHWCSLLGQEGVPFSCDSLDVLDRASGARPDVRVLIADRPAERSELPALRRFLAQGGAVLSYADNVRLLWPEPKTQKARRLRYIMPDRSLPFQNVSVVDLCTTGTIIPAANCGQTPSGRPAIFCGRLQGSLVALLPFDPARVLANEDSEARVFAADAPRPVFETVASTGRGEVRRLTANCLKYLLYEQDTSYVRLSHTPDSGSVFGVRIDTDTGSEAAWRTTASVASGHGMRFSWYVHTGNTQGRLCGLVRDVIAAHDIQLHCYEHRVREAYEDNRRDMDKGVALLRECGITPEGVVAPYGLWNRNWARAAEEAGMSYSSEFAQGYDDVPFRPLLDGRATGVLQVPVHPICSGRLASARMPEPKMVAYFSAYAARQAARLEPCFIYDHPETIARHLDAFGGIVESCLRHCERKTTLTDYARWWRMREKVRYAAAAKPGAVEVSQESGAPGFDLVIEQEGRWAALPLKDGKIVPARLEWRERKVVADDIAALRKARAPSLRVKYQETLRARGRRVGR